MTDEIPDTRPGRSDPLFLTGTAPAPSGASGPGGTAASAAPDLDPALLAAREYTWATQLRRHAHQFPQRAALRIGGRTVSWGELDGRVDAAAGDLRLSGVRADDRVTLLIGNTTEYVVALLAVMRLGALAVPVNVRLAAEEIAWILTDSGSRVLVRDAENAASAATLGGRVAGLVVLDAERLGVPSVSRATPDVELVPTSAPCLIVYTSGTTGRPKGAVLTHLNLLLQAVTGVRSRFLLGDDEVMLVATPLFHIAALGSLASMLMVGGTVVLPPPGPFDAADAVRLLEEERVTAAFFVPTQWDALCAVPGLAERSLCLRSISWGASPALPTTLEAMAQTFPGIPIVAAFGQTEMSPVTCVLDGRDAPRKPGSIGRPVPTVAIRIVDDEMNDVAPGEVGEIVYRGASTMAGYWTDPAATEEAFRGGWFHSGDLVRADDEGFLYVVDRKKDMIVSGGENVYSAEVEHVVSRHPGVREVAVVGVPHPKWVETPLAVIVPADPQAPPTLADIQAWCRGRLAAYKKPTQVAIVDALPRNAGGKVLKGDLRRRYAAAAPAGS